jgi:HEAT repeat protein
MPALISPIVPEGRQYDFFHDLEGGTAETVYVGVKALGFLPELAAKSTKPLCRVMESSEDGRIRLEAAASLARLRCEEGWNVISRIATNADTPNELRMESALLLAELPDHRSIDLLKALLENTSNEPELRAAAAWGLAGISDDAESSGLLAYLDDGDELVAVHAILGVSRVLTADSLASILPLLGDNDRRSAGLVRAVLLTQLDFVPQAVRLIDWQQQWEATPMADVLARLSRSGGV